MAITGRAFPSRPTNTFRAIRTVAASPAATLSGTAVPTLRPEEIVLGGKTIIITLERTTWVTAGATFDAIRQDIIDGLDAATDLPTGWNLEVRDNLAVTTVVRTSDTVVTITLSAQAAYSSPLNEIVTVIVPASATAANVLIPAGTISVIEYAELPLGLSALFLFRPDWTPVTGNLGPLIPLGWKRSRFINRAGTWEVVLPVDQQPIDGVPFLNQVTTGWHVCLVQEGVHPEDDLAKEYLLYMGEVLDRQYEMNEGSVQLVLKGVSRMAHLAERSTYRGLEYSGDSATTIAQDLVDGDLIIGPNGGVIMPEGASAISPSITFNDITRLAGMLKLGELTRYYLRESWDFDKPEFTKVDNPPDSGVTLRRVEAYDPGLDDAARAGIGVIAGTPRVHYVGTEIINRIIPIGSDTPEGDLTLEHVSDFVFSPYNPEDIEDFALQLSYPVYEGTNPDGSSYFYIQDQESIDLYGVRETTLIRTDVKNPTDDDDTREAAANVLYIIAINQLLKHRSEVVVVNVEVANGSNIWANAGDRVKLDLAGWVETEAGRLAWIDFDNKHFIVTERHEESHPSGVRKVRFTLAAPVIEIPIPDLPEGEDGESFPLPPAPGPLPLPPLPEIPVLPNCCDDPTTDIPDAGPPEAPLPLPPAAGVGIGEAAARGRDDVLIFVTNTSGALVSLPDHLEGGTAVTTDDMFDDPDYLVAVNEGDYIVTFGVTFKYNTDIGAGSSNIFHARIIGDGNEVLGDQIATLDEDDTVTLSASAVQRDVGAGTQFWLEIVSEGGPASVRLNPAGSLPAGGSSYIKIQRFTNLVCQTLLGEVCD